MSKKPRYSRRSRSGQIRTELAAIAEWNAHQHAGDHAPSRKWNEGDQTLYRRPRVPKNHITGDLAPGRVLRVPLTEDNLIELDEPPVPLDVDDLD